MANGTIMPTPVFTGFDNSGAIVASGLLYTYAAGTTTNLATYSNVGLTSANANPVVLDSAGRAVVYLGPYSYKFVLKDSTGATTYWTQDNISAIPLTNVDLDVTGTAGEAIAAGEFVYLSTGTGGRTAGRWYLTDGRTAAYSSTAVAIGAAPAAIASGASGSIRLQGRVTGLSSLTAGTTYYASDTPGALSSSAGTNERALAVADSTTAAVLSYWIVGHASGTAAGIVNLAAQTLGDGLKHFKQQPTFDPGTSDPTSATTKTSGVIKVDTTAVANVGGGADDLITYSLPANVLDANGKGVRITWLFQCANTADNKTIICYFGSTAVLTFAANGYTNLALKAVAEVFRTGASAQLSFCIGTASGTASTILKSTPAEACSGAITIKATGESATSTSNEVVQEALLVEIIN